MKITTFYLSKLFIIFCLYLLSGCAERSENIYSVASQAQEASRKESDDFLAFVDSEKIKLNYLSRGFSQILINSPTSPASPGIVSMLFGGRDSDELINVHFVEKKSATEFYYFIQCINSPKNNLKFTFNLVDNKWKITDYIMVPD